MPSRVDYARIGRGAARGGSLRLPRVWLLAFAASLSAKLLTEFLSQAHNKELL